MKNKCEICGEETEETRCEECRAEWGDVLFPDN
jgi:hypothetical protein